MLSVNYGCVMMFYLLRAPLSQMIFNMCLSFEQLLDYLVKAELLFQGGNSLVHIIRLQREENRKNTFIPIQYQLPFYYLLTQYCRLLFTLSHQWSCYHTT